jgi:hypothetical protein
LCYPLEVIEGWGGRRTEDVGFACWVERSESKDEEGLGREGVGEDGGLEVQGEKCTNGIMPACWKFRRSYISWRGGIYGC